MPLVYRNTFIQEVEVDGASRRRASSQEPHRSPALAAEALEMERTLKHFVSSLVYRVQQHPETWSKHTETPAGNEGQERPESNQDGRAVQAAARSTDVPEEPSWGSRGHPHLCQKPCLRFAGGRGRCEQGERCEFCHMGHETRAKLDKQQRSFFNSLPQAAAMAVLCQLMEEKAAQNGFLEEARPLLSQLLLEAGQVEPHAKLRRVEKVLRRYSFRQLLGLALPIANDSDDLQQRASILTDQVRMICG